jgi:UDP-N-acetylmuramoyl-L-alanyl-D-glutamate--2,6-diaminopimelate ligase
VKLKDLFPLAENGDTEILGMTADSRKVEPGWLFAALKGSVQDGRDFVPMASEIGSAACLFRAAERKIDTAEEVFETAERVSECAEEKIGAAEELFGTAEEVFATAVESAEEARMAESKERFMDIIVIFILETQDCRE